jgi:hypothetical protein
MRPDNSRSGQTRKELSSRPATVTDNVNVLCKQRVLLFSLAIVIREGCPSFVGQLNKFAILSDYEALVVLKIVYDHAWLDADDTSLHCVTALA